MIFYFYKYLKKICFYIFYTKILTFIVMFFMFQTCLSFVYYSINDTVFEKKQNVFPSIADSNQYTREFSLRRSTVHSNQIGDAALII